MYTPEEIRCKLVNLPRSIINLMTTNKNVKLCIVKASLVACVGHQFVVELVLCGYRLIGETA